MIKGGYHLEKVKPNIFQKGNVAFTADDVLFDWTAFQIPRGAVALRSVGATVSGTNGVAANGGLDIDLYFATTVDGVAPPSLGNSNDAMTAILASAARPHIVHYQMCDGSTKEDAGDGMVAFNVWGAQDKRYGNWDNILEGDANFKGDSNYSATVSGYQTIWVAGVAQGAFDFGTAILLNQAGNQASSAKVAGVVTLTVDGTDANIAVSVGDELISFVAANGSTPKKIGKVKATAANTKDFASTMAMQKRLIAKGAKIKADGIMGAKTRAAMKKFMSKPTVPAKKKVMVDSFKKSNVSANKNKKAGIDAAKGDNKKAKTFKSSNPKLDSKGNYKGTNIKPTKLQLERMKKRRARASST